MGSIWRSTRGVVLAALGGLIAVGAMGPVPAAAGETDPSLTKVQAIYAADKLAKARELRALATRLHVALTDPALQERVEHYQKSLETLDGALPGIRLGGDQERGAFNDPRTAAEVRVAV